MSVSSRRFLPLLAAALALPLLVSPPAAAQEAQEYLIRGTVLEAATEAPLPNAAVSLQGTRFGVLTDEAGAYTLRAQVAPGTYTLEFRLIGRRPVRQPIELGEQREVTVEPVLLEITAVPLEDIVVTGVGVAARRGALGSTVESVSGAEVSQSPGAAAIDIALQGRITGAIISEHSGQPGGGTSIRLRGTSTILGNAEPLIVVDGVIIDNSNEALVSLAANAPRGNASMSNRLSDFAPGEIERIEVLKGAAAAGLYGSRANSGVIQIFTAEGRAGAPRITYRSEVAASETPARYALNMAPQAGLADVVFGGAPEVGASVERFDVQDQIWRTGVGTTNELSIAGGTEETSYFLSGSYNTQQGIVRGTDYERVNVRGRLTQSLFDGLMEVRASGAYMDAETSFVPEGEQTQGALTVAIFTPTTFDYSFDEDLGRFPLSPVLGANPLDVIANWEAPENVTRFLGGLGATVLPTDRLTLRYQFGLDDYRQENRYLIPPQATSLAFTGSIQNPVRFSRQINNDLTGEYAFPLGENVTSATTAGFSYTSDHTEVLRAAAEDLPPGQRLVGGATQFASQGISEIRTLGGFVQQQFGVNDRLFVTGGVNLEASSAFGADERWQAFPRVNASWLVHEQPFWREGALADVLSTLRLRAAYGETGGQPPGAYLRFDNFFNVAFAGRAGLVPGLTTGNPELRPERQREFEAGLDLGLLGDRANLELSWYHQTTDDLVLAVPLAPSVGAQQQLQNIGELRNRGVEAALTTINIQSPDFRWTSRLQFATNRNRVEQLVTAADTLVFGYLNAVVEGQPLGVFYGGVYERDAQGNIVYNENGHPLRETDPETGAFTNRIIGDPNPDFVASLSNTFNVGDRFEVSALLDGRFGNDVADFTRRITEFFGVDRVVEREITGDTVPGTFALNPTGRINIFEEYIEDGTFVKLREVSARYSIPEPFGGRLGVRSLDIRVAARNLFTITDYGGLDPEINLFAANPVARGVDFATTPIPRTFLAGVTLRL